MGVGAERLGPYELRGELGRGAMAVVWRAWDPNLEREVAIKEPMFDNRLPSDVLAEMGRRFVAEAKAAARLDHPNIVTIHAADVYDGRPAIVMELVDGSTLAELTASGPLDAQFALNVLDQLLDAVGYAHSKGIVHRDIKPDNVFVDRFDRVKLADFGIAHVDGAAEARATVVGTVLGTPGYMSPEQAKGEPVDSRSDLFSVGVLGYEMLAGRNPFGAGDGADSTTLLYRIVHEPAPDLPPVTSAGLPADMRPAIMMALSKDPAARPQSAQVFKTILHGGVSPQGRAGSMGGQGVPAMPANPRGSLGGQFGAPQGSLGGQGGASQGSFGGQGGVAQSAAPFQAGAGQGRQTPPVQPGVMPGQPGMPAMGGIPQQPQGVQPQSVQPQAKSGMPKWAPYAIVAAICVVVLAFVLVSALSGGGGGGTGGAAPGAATTSSPATAQSNSAAAATPKVDTTDIVSDARYFLVDEGDTFKEYIVVFSGKDTGALTSFADVTNFDKSGGYTLDYLQSYNVEEAYPKFNSLGFTSKKVEEKSNHFKVTCRFDKLKDKDNLRALNDAGILTISTANADYVLGESLCDLLIDSGAKEIDSSAAMTAGLPIA